MSTKTIAQMTDTELAEYMGQDATAADAAIMRELLRAASLIDDPTDEIDDAEWSRLLALIPVKREANECEDYFRSQAHQPDRGIMDADHVTRAKNKCERYVELCGLLDEWPDNCANYARVARRVDEVLDEALENECFEIDHALDIAMRKTGSKYSEDYLRDLLAKGETFSVNEGRDGTKYAYWLDDNDCWAVALDGSETELTESQIEELLA